MARGQGGHLLIAPGLQVRLDLDQQVPVALRKAIRLQGLEQGPGEGSLIDAFNLAEPKSRKGRNGFSLVAFHLRA